MFRSASLILVAFALPLSAADYPAVLLKVDGAELTVYQPDAKTGYYRGSRFDWSGVIANLKIGENTLFGPWKDKHDPANNDDITGPCEEFGMEAPLGYAEAAVGETFLKIGIGELEKPKEEKYRFFHNYKIANNGTWRVSKVTGLPGESASIEFRHTIRTKSGYAYHYKKTLSIASASEGKHLFLDLRHELINTGEKTIETDYYNHNFFNVNAEPIGPRYRIEFPKAIAATAESKFVAPAVLKDSTFTFAAALPAKESAFGWLTAPDGKPMGYDFEMIFAGKEKGRGVRMRVNGQGQTVSKFQLWSIQSCLCPEPFVKLKVEPGDSTSWMTTYHFRASE